MHVGEPTESCDMLAQTPVNPKQADADIRMLGKRLGVSGGLGGSWFVSSNGGSTK
jgi:hypothetical protein